MAKDDTSSFARDFGYLMPFLDKLQAAASSLSDPAAKAELVALLKDEKPRWQRIQALIGGAPGKQATGGAAPATAPAKAGGPAPQEPGRAAAGFTVGPLKRRA